MYCSRRCKNSATNKKSQSYSAQQSRGYRRKLRLVKASGGRCGRCGYSSNLAALEFHHKSKEAKSFQLDLRSLSNRNLSKIAAEVLKCELVCSNCHKEIHNPRMMLNS